MKFEDKMREEAGNCVEGGWKSFVFTGSTISTEA